MAFRVPADFKPENRRCFKLAGFVIARDGNFGNAIGKGRFQVAIAVHAIAAGAVSSAFVIAVGAIEDLNDLIGFIFFHRGAGITFGRAG